MKNALRKTTALLLAMLTVLSVSVFGLGSFAADTCHISLSTAFYTYNSESGIWEKAAVLHPNQAVKLRIGVNTDFDCNNGQLVLAFDKSVLTPSFTDGRNAALNPASPTLSYLQSVYISPSTDASKGLTKRLLTIGNITEADSAKYGFIAAIFEPKTSQTHFAFDGSTWLFEVDMTVNDISGKSAQAILLPKTVANTANITGYSVFYKFVSKESTDTEGSMVWYTGTPDMTAEPAYVQAAAETHTHSFTEQTYIASTCDTAGISVFLCSCGAVQKYGTIAAGHQYGDFVFNGATAKTHTKVCARDSSHIVTEACQCTSAVTTNPTCLHPGERTYTCSVCQGTYTEEEPCIGHQYAKVWSSNAANHWHACTADPDCTAKSDLAAHYDDNGDGCCDVCGTAFAEPYSLCTLKIRGNKGANTVDYRNGIQLTAVTEPAPLPENTQIVWYVNDVKAGTDLTFVKTDIRSAFKVTVRLEDNNGNALHDREGNEIRDEEQINVNAGFFKKIVAFFRWLFRRLKTTVQSLSY